MRVYRLRTSLQARNSNKKNTSQDTTNFLQLLEEIFVKMRFERKLQRHRYIFTIPRL